jgi:signal peptidase I
VSAGGPPNPYAPSEALAHDVAAEAKERRPRKPSRVLATVATFLANPLIGAGFHLLGKTRRFAAWITAGLLVTAVFVVAVRTRQPQLCVAAMAATWLATIAATVATALTRSERGTTGWRAWLVALALIIAGKGGGLAVRHWLAAPFNIPSGSMMPTLLVGDQMYVKMGSAGVGRGDVIVFNAPQPPGQAYIKRVMAVGGDTIEVKHGAVSVNGAELEQIEAIKDCDVPEVAACTLATEHNGDHEYMVMFTGHIAPDLPRTTVPPDHVFVMGDNRDNSHDSRAWGSLPVDQIKGIVTLTWWSYDAKTGVRWSRVGHGVQ